MMAGGGYQAWCGVRWEGSLMWSAPAGGIRRRRSCCSWLYRRCTQHIIRSCGRCICSPALRPHLLLMVWGVIVLSVVMVAPVPSVRSATLSSSEPPPTAPLSFVWTGASKWSCAMRAIPFCNPDGGGTAYCGCGCYSKLPPTFECSLLAPSPLLPRLWASLGERWPRQSPHSCSMGGGGYCSPPPTLPFMAFALVAPRHYRRAPRCISRVCGRCAYSPALLPSVMGGSCCYLLAVGLVPLLPLVPSGMRSSASFGCAIASVPCALASVMDPSGMRSSSSIFLRSAPFRF